MTQEPTLIAKGADHYRIAVVIDSRLDKPDQMRVLQDLLVELYDGFVVMVPADFVTDCHSTPAWTAFILPEYDNRTNLAAIVHDYLYMHFEEFAQCTGQMPDRLDPVNAWIEFGPDFRDYADSCYYELMERFHPGGWRNKVYYAAVRAFGWYNWRKFRKLNKRKLCHEKQT